MKAINSSEQVVETMGYLDEHKRITDADAGIGNVTVMDRIRHGYQSFKLGIAAVVPTHEGAYTRGFPTTRSSEEVDQSVNDMLNAVKERT